MPVLGVNHLHRTHLGSFRVLVPARQRRPEVGMLLLAILLLAFGVLVYVFDRGGAVYFLSTWTATLAESNAFGPLGDHLPTFVHTLAFILITAAILRPWPRQFRSTTCRCGA